VGVGVKDLGVGISHGGDGGEVMGKNVGGAPFYFGIIGTLFGGLGNLKDFGGDVLVIIKSLVEVGVLGGGGCGGVFLESLPSGGEGRVVSITFPRFSVIGKENVRAGSKVEVVFP